MSYYFEYEMPKENPGENISVKLLQAGIYKFDEDKNYNRIPHSHNFTEIFLITSGTGYIMYCENKYDIKKGDILIINSNIEHYELSLSNLEYYVLCLKDIYFENINASTFIFTPQNDFSKYSNLAKICLDELANKHNSYYQLAQNAATSLILFLMRELNTNVSNPTNTATSTPLLQVKMLLDSGSSFSSLDELAELAHMSKFHFIRCFKQMTGYTPKAYMLNLNLEIARKLLVFTSQPIVTIALSVGFSSPANFIKQFKEKFDTTPKQYRILNKK